MKEKITQLAKGIFEYELPEVLLSEEVLNLQIEAGKDYYGSFTVKNNKKNNLKGVIYSSSYLMEIKTTSFVGEDNEIQYIFHGKDLSPREVYKGNISIVSSSGEIKLPFEAKILETCAETSLGEIEDLFNFANLAKTNWAEAMKLFKSEEFCDIFLERDPKNKLVYEGLIKGISTSQALEEFLIAIHKKTRISLAIEKTSLKYKLGNKIVGDKITLNKDQWGYVEISITTDAEFIITERKKLWADNFIGNTYSLGFELEPEKMRPGKNYGKIIFKTIFQTLEVEIEAECLKEGRKKDKDYFKKKEYSLQLVNNYLNFRSNRIDLKEYVKDTETLLRRYGEIQKDKSLELFRIHLYLVDGQEERAEELLNMFEAEKEELEKNDVADFCGYLYLKALYSKEEKDVEEAVQMISKCYKQENHQWNILWYLLFLDRRFENNKAAKLRAIKEQYENGCHSPVLYYEVCSVYNDDPALIKELDGFALQALNMGIKMDCLSWQAAAQYNYLASRTKGFHGLIYKNMISIYQKYRTKDVLFTICSMLIKGEKTGKEHFPWYQLGVEAQLRITELHEYYMYSVDEEMAEVMPQEIYLYFMYNNNLPDRKKACLFANIVRNKERNPSIYNTYLKQIESFTRKQLIQHSIDSNLAVLYEDIITEDTLTLDMAKHLPYIMFTQQIICQNHRITGVYVAHKECRDESYIPMENGKAYINIFTDHAEVFLVDAEGNRFTATMEYVLEKLMHLDKMAEKCYEYAKESGMLLLYLCEQVHNYQKSGDDISYLRRILEIDGLKEHYKRKSMMRLIQYYYDNYEEEALESLLKQVDIHNMDKTDRIQVLEYTILRGLYDIALTRLEEFGYEGVGIKRLYRLCTKLIENWDIQINKPILTQLSFYVFQEGKFDETIIRYLVNHFIGTTQEMFRLWKQAAEYEINTVELEERLLGQMLFAESYITDALSVFLSYYPKGSNQMLIRGFLAYYSYKYVVFDRVVPDTFFEILEKEAAFEEAQVGMMALLKYYTTLPELTEEQVQLADFNIHKFVERKIILPFFKKFSKVITLPSSICNNYYIQYITNPENEVKIHYFIEDEERRDDFKEEIMENVFYGIHVKAFTLFYNEALQYYVVEKSKENSNITESVMVRLEENFEGEEDSYSSINTMLVARELQDEKTLLDMMKSYIKTDYAIGQVFKMLS